MNTENSTFITDYANTKADLQSIKSDVHNIEKLVSKLDVAIEKMSEISSSINRLLAVHDSKIENHQRLIGDLLNTVDKRRAEADERVSEINTRILDLKEDIRSDGDSQKKELIAEMNLLFNKTNDNYNDIEERLGSLEKWRWVIVGACMVLASISTKLGWLAVITG